MMTTTNSTAVTMDAKFFSDLRKAETKAVKAALIARGFGRVRVGHGRGTSYSWLDITLEYVGEYFATMEEIRAIAIRESGRTGRAAENISITICKKDGN